MSRGMSRCLLACFCDLLLKENRITLVSHSKTCAYLFNSLQASHERDAHLFRLHFRGLSCPQPLTTATATAATTTIICPKYKNYDRECCCYVHHYQNHYHTTGTTTSTTTATTTTTTTTILLLLFYNHYFYDY